MDTIKLDHLDTWRGTHRGVNLEVSRRIIGGTELSEEYPAWAHYITLHEMAVPERLHDAIFLPRQDGRPHWNEYEYGESMLAELYWHYGITYFAYMEREPGDRVIKAGCDYSHLWDMEAGYPYDEQGVAREACDTIDSLWTAIPDLLVRCGKTGKWIPAETAKAAG